MNRVHPYCTVAKFPNPDTSGVPGSGRNWVLAPAGPQDIRRLSWL